MQNHNSNVLKGRVAVIAPADNDVVCQAVGVELTGDESKVIIHNLVNFSCPHAIAYPTFGKDFFDSFLWGNLTAYNDLGILSDVMLEFSRQVTAAFGSGCYLFDLTGRVDVPYKLSKTRFRKLIESYEMDYLSMKSGSLVSTALEQLPPSKTQSTSSKSFAKESAAA